MNEWGIPDWREPAVYGNVLAWSDVRWRWEFRRRLQSFRADCDAILALHDEAKAALEVFKKTRDERRRDAFNALVDSLENIRLQHLFSWGYVPDLPPLDPRNSDYPDDMLKVWPVVGASSMLGSPNAKPHELKNVTRPKEGQISITFSLEQPLSESLALAERVLRRNQKEQMGRVIHKSHDPKKNDARARLWLQYLRVMDGKAAIKRKEFGPPRTWDDIGAVIYDFDQGAGDKARKAHATALKLAANFP